VVGAGYFFAFFDIVTISFATPVIATQFHVSKPTVTLSVTSSLIGYIIGAFADSTIADKWGRRLSLGISVSVFSIGTILAALSTNVTELIIFRFISGLGIGAEISASSRRHGCAAATRAGPRRRRMQASRSSRSSPAVSCRRSPPGGGSCSESARWAGSRSCSCAARCPTRRAGS
jgi:MFS family permease